MFEGKPEEVTVDWMPIKFDFLNELDWIEVIRKLIVRSLIDCLQNGDSGMGEKFSELPSPTIPRLPELRAVLSEVGKRISDAFHANSFHVRNPSIFDTTMGNKKVKIFQKIMASERKLSEAMTTSSPRRRNRNHIHRA